LSRAECILLQELSKFMLLYGDHVKDVNVLLSQVQPYIGELELFLAQQRDSFEKQHTTRANQKREQAFIRERDKYQGLIKLLAGKYPIEEDKDDEDLSIIASIFETAGAPEHAETLLKSIVRVLDASEQIMPLILRTIKIEVQKTTGATTLFRGSSTASKLMMWYTKVLGLPYLEKTIKPYILTIINSNIAFEVDPQKN